jgi:hypothetical protein
MCNEYERYVDWYAYCKLMQDLEWGTRPSSQNVICRRPAVSESGTWRP